MIGKVSRATVEEYAKVRGLEPVQIDGIPEGFSFKHPNLIIGKEEHEGMYVAYLPLKDWGDAVYSSTTDNLLELYKQNESKK